MINKKINALNRITDQAPLLSFNFLVSFLDAGLGVGGVNPIDIRFQKVSGIDMSIALKTKRIGGEKVRMPDFPEYSNLTLERGYVQGSLLRLELEAKFANLKFSPRNVLVMLLDPQGLPMVAWHFFGAYPVKWSISSLDASQSSLLIETIELSYTRFQPISL